MAKPSITSLSESRVRAFIASDDRKSELYCEKITGFHVIKTKTSASYRLRYTNAEGKKKRVTIGKFSQFKPYQAAEKALEIITGGVDPLAERKATRQKAVNEKALAEMRTVEGYLNGLYTMHQSKKRSGESTISMIRYNFQDFLNRDMFSLTKADIKNWQRKREKEGVKFPTIQRAYGALKTMLNKAVDDEVLESNPLPRTSPLEKPHFEEVDRQIQSKKERRVLEGNEVAALFGGLEAYAGDLRRQRANSIAHGKKWLESYESVSYPHWMIPFTYTAYYTGLRSGDIYSLTWNELNLNFKRITKTPSKTRHHKEPIEVNLDLPDSYVSIMEEWHKQQGCPSHGLVFPNARGVQFDKKAHSKAWNHIKRFAELPEDLVFYTLRHNFISQLVMAGYPLFTVARLAGHKSVKMIEQNYGDLSPAHTRNALNVLNPKNSISEVRSNA